MPGAWKYTRTSAPIEIPAVTLNAIANRPEGYFTAPEADGLASLYGQIAAPLLGWREFQLDRPTPMPYDIHKPEHVHD